MRYDRRSDAPVAQLDRVLPSEGRGFFEVYARRGPLPVLGATETDEGLLLEWRNMDDPEFPMPIRIDGSLQRVDIEGNRAWLAGLDEANVKVDPFMQVARKLPPVPTCEERRAEEQARSHHR